MATSLQQLNAAQRKAYDEFLDMAGDIIKPTHKEHHLLPWLNDTKFDAKKSVKIFRECMQWREKHGIDNIIEERKRGAPKFYMERFDGKGMVGFDKEGCPVWILPAGRWDLKGLFLATHLEDVVLEFVSIWERSRVEEEKQTSKVGHPVTRKTVIVDCQNMDYTVAAWKTTWKAASKCFHIVGQYYPGSLKTFFVINAPPFVPPLYSAMKHMLHDVARKTIKIYSKNRSEWVPALLEEIDPTQLPQHWGGTCVDPDGDPMCPSKITIECKVPKTMYMKSVSELGIKGMKTVFVDSGSTYQVDMEVKKDGSKLRWTIYTDATRLCVKIHRRVADGLREVDGFELKECYFTVTEGETMTLGAGKYVMTFDNSNFKLRGRTVSYLFVEVHTVDM